MATARAQIDPAEGPREDEPAAAPDDGRGVATSAHAAEPAEGDDAIAARLPGSPG